MLLYLLDIVFIQFATSNSQRVVSDGIPILFQAAWPCSISGFHLKLKAGARCQGSKTPLLLTHSET